MVEVKSNLPRNPWHFIDAELCNSHSAPASMRNCEICIHWSSSQHWHIFSVEGHLIFFIIFHWIVLNEESRPAASSPLSAWMFERGVVDWSADNVPVISPSVDIITHAQTNINWGQTSYFGRVHNIKNGNADSENNSDKLKFCTKLSQLTENTFQEWALSANYSMQSDIQLRVY